MSKQTNFIILKMTIEGYTIKSSEAKKTSKNFNITQLSLSLLYTHTHKNVSIKRRKTMKVNVNRSFPVFSGIN